MGPEFESELTEAEKRYFQSGGSDTEGLELEDTSEVVTPSDPVEPQSEPAPEQQVQQPAASSLDDDDDDDFSGDGLPEGIRVVQGKDGRPRFQGPDGKFVKMVPHGALHKTRERLKEEKRARAEIQEKWARGEERLNILNEAFNGGGQTQPPGATQQKPDDPFSEEPIDPGQDIFGAYEQLQRQNKALFDRFSSTQAQQQTRDYATNVSQAYHADTEAFRAKEPNYDDAVRHVVNMRIGQLRAMGIADPAQINQTIQREEAELVMQAITNKKSPAAMFFEMAKALGFQPTAQNGNVNQNNGKNSAVEKIEQINRGKQAADTLSNAGGSANEGLTIERLANMTDDEFAAARASMPKAQFERLMGKV